MSHRKKAILDLKGRPILGNEVQLTLAYQGTTPVVGSAVLLNPLTMPLVDPNVAKTWHPFNEGSKWWSWCYVPEIWKSPQLGVEFTGITRTCPCNGVWFNESPNDRPFLIQNTPDIWEAGQPDSGYPSSICNWFKYYIGIMGGCPTFMLVGSDGYPAAGKALNECGLADGGGYSGPCNDRTSGFYCWCGMYMTFLQVIHAPTPTKSGKYRLWMVQLITSPGEIVEGDHQWYCLNPIPAAMMFFAEFHWDFKSIITIDNWLTQSDCNPAGDTSYPEWIQGWANSWTGDNTYWGPPEGDPFCPTGRSGGGDGSGVVIAKSSPTIDGYGGSVTLTPFCKSPEGPEDDCSSGFGSESSEGNDSSGGTSNGSGGSIHTCTFHWIATYDCVTKQWVGPFFAGYLCGAPARGWQQIPGNPPPLCAFDTYIVATNGSKCPNCVPGMPPAPPDASECDCGGSSSSSSSSFYDELDEPRELAPTKSAESAVVDQRVKVQRASMFGKLAPQLADHPNLVPITGPRVHVPGPAKSFGPPAQILVYRAMWEQLHLRALCFRGDVAAEKSFIKSLTDKLPCGRCKKKWKRILKRMPPDFRSLADYFVWTVEVHNEVSEDLRHKLWDEGEAFVHWSLRLQELGRFDDLKFLAKLMATDDYAHAILAPIH